MAHCCFQYSKPFSSALNPKKKNFCFENEFLPYFHPTNSNQMKKFTTLFLAIIATALFANAQSFSDDFEIYTAGSLLAASSPTWGTWTSPNGGGADDAAVSNAMAHSGSNSLYLTSTSATGGPDDIILPFGGEINTGTVNFNSWMYVPAGKGGYFNFQQDSIVGQVWTVEVFLTTAGQLKFQTNTGGLLFQTTYPQGAWFQFDLNINLNTSDWDVSINGSQVGSFQNAIYQVASMDFYPDNASAALYIDDVSFNVTPYTVPSLNGGVLALDILNGLVTQQVKPSVTVRNLGTTPITSFDLTVDYNGTQITENVTGLNVASLATTVVNFTNTITLIAGSNDATCTISNVNGNATDDDASDDVKTLTLNPTVPAPGKVVVAEEGTGTWCQWCPRGAVFMDLMTENFGQFFKGIAVHNGDIMTVTDYDAAIGGLISGYPSALVDRQPEIDPSEIEASFMSRVVIAPTATLENGATYNSTTRELKVSIKTTFVSAINGDFKLTCVLTEDSVHGTTSSYNQSNAYSGGSNGVMGGFELLGNPVPAALMNYNHVARVIYPSFAGFSTYPTSVAAGTIITRTATFTLPAGWDETMIEIVSMFIDPAGEIDNAGSATIAEAVANGFTNDIDITAFTSVPSIFAAPDAQVSLSPNPAADFSVVTLNLKSATEVSLAIYSVDGKLLSSKNFGTLNNGYELPINTSNLVAGMYWVEVSLNGNRQVMKLVKE